MAKKQKKGKKEYSTAVKRHTKNIKKSGKVTTKQKKGKKEYSKIHLHPTAVKGHIKNIKKRGGKVTTKKVGKNTQLNYSFNSR